jgi:hypothetical protein
MSGLKHFPHKGTHMNRPESWARIPILTALWIVAVAVGSMFLIRYEITAGPSRSAPSMWPSITSIPRDSKLPTLVMFAHPHCPCTRASLGELELLMARSRGRCSANVLFIRPTGTIETWKETDLWRKASAIPGVIVRWDDAGIEASRFNAETSGQTLLYGRDGTLLFQGGITISRGHSGDNPGRSALEALVDDGFSNPNKTPVFGCALFAAECQQRGVACKR